MRKVIFVILILLGLVTLGGLFLAAKDTSQDKAQELLESTLKAQNLARLNDVNQVQLALNTYFKEHNVWPPTLQEVFERIPRLLQTDMSDLLYTPSKNGQGYTISFSLEDGRRFEVNENQSALDYREEAENPPGSATFSEEQLQAIEEELNIDQSEIARRRSKSLDVNCWSRVVRIQGQLGFYFDEHGLYPTTLGQLPGKYVPGISWAAGLESVCEPRQIRYALAPGNTKYHLGVVLENCEIGGLAKDADFDSSRLEWEYGFDGTDNDGNCPDGKRVFDVHSEFKYEEP